MVPKNILTRGWVYNTHFLAQKSYLEVEILGPWGTFPRFRGISRGNLHEPQCPVGGSKNIHFDLFWFLKDVAF